jgi:hypothetical protein
VVVVVVVGGRWEVEENTVVAVVKRSMETVTFCSVVLAHSLH